MVKILKIPPEYKLSKKAILLLSEIEANRAVVDSINVPIELEKNIRRESILGSALFSARIEGNLLTRAEIQSFSDLSKKDQQKLEITNLYRVIEKIVSDFPVKKKMITKADLLRWQKHSMSNILASEYLGKFRNGHEGLFDAAGNIIYHAPPPPAIPSLIFQLLRFANTKKEKIPVIRAILAHLIFEKIHPFVDGNGRVGRLLQLAILCRNGYVMKGLTVVEEEIDNNRQSYYRAIEDSTIGKHEHFIELMLEFLRDASAKAKENLITKKTGLSKLDTLPPRQKEMVQLISEQKLMSLDQLHRRFLRISPSQIAYDLRGLEKRGFIVKIGKTRGALYSVKS